MSKYEKRLMKKAYRSHKRIFPCGARASFSECFTIMDGNLFFWFNTKDGSTHIVKLVDIYIENYNTKQYYV